jgi:hypothetical protein
MELIERMRGEKFNSELCNGDEREKERDAVSEEGKLTSKKKI